MGIPTSFEAAAKFLGKKLAKNIPGKRSTRVERIDSEKIALYYHTTPVVTWFSDGRSVIRANGFRTATTKNRINDAVPGCYVWQRHFEWWVTLRGNGPVEPFQDGFTVA